MQDCDSRFATLVSPFVSPRYFSLAAASALLSASLQSAASVLFDTRWFHVRCHLPRSRLCRLCRLPSGPYSLLYFGLVLYYRYPRHTSPARTLSYFAFTEKFPLPLTSRCSAFGGFPPPPSPSARARVAAHTAFHASCSNKIFAYILAAQVAISSVPSPASAIAAVCR